MKARRLATIAAWINANSTALNLRAETRSAHVNTDRKIPGTRLLWPGKGRSGVEIKIFYVKGGVRNAWGGAQFVSKLSPKARARLQP